MEKPMVAPYLLSIQLMAKAKWASISVVVGALMPAMVGAY